MSSPSDVIPAQEPQEVPAAHEEDDADSVVAIETPVDVPAKPARGPRRKQVRRTSKKVLEDEVMEDPAHDASAQHLPDETKDHDEDMVHQEMVEDLTPRPRYKSFRKKYRKMRIYFEDTMEEANDLFIREHKAWDIAKRIQEQNDQLLDIIHDLELETRGKGDASKPPNLEALMAETVHAAPSIVPKNLLPPDIVDLETENPLDGVPPGFLGTDHETEYLSALDASLSAIPSTDNLPQSLEAIQPPSRNRDKVQLREQDFAIRNPISVHNWLRKHKPDLFNDRERDRVSERSGKSPVPEGIGRKLMAKRTSKDQDKAASLVKAEALSEVDELGEPLESTSSSRGKRKRDDDTYRPKGGSGRAAKSRRGQKEENGKVTRRSRGADEETPAEDEE